MRFTLLALALFASGCATANSPATTAAPDSLDVRTWADASDAVVLGTVTAIDYRTSLPQSDGTRLPFTFVTLTIERAWSGATAGDSLTLRLAGGPTSDGGLILNSEQPIFQMGDRDVLFVSGNDVGAVPFYKGSFSRLRLIDGAAYDNEGDGMQLSATGELGRGDWHELPSLNVVDIGGHLLEQNPDRLESPTVAPALSEPGLLAALDDQLQGLADRAPVASADPSVPVDFDIAGMKIGRAHV